MAQVSSLGNMMASVLPDCPSSYHTIRERENILWLLPWKRENIPAFKKPCSFFLFLIGYGVPNPEYSLVFMEMDYVDWLKLRKDTLKIRGWWWGPSMPSGIYNKENMCTREKFLSYSKDKDSKLKMSMCWVNEWTIEFILILYALTQKEPSQNTI